MSKQPYKAVWHLIGTTLEGKILVPFPKLLFYLREEEYVNPIIFGLFSPELWTAVKTVFCKRNDKVKRFY